LPEREREICFKYRCYQLLRLCNVGRQCDWLMFTEFSKNCIVFLLRVEHSVLKQPFPRARVSLKMFRVAWSRRILRLCSTKFHYRFHQSTPLHPMIVCLNPLYDFTLPLKIQFNIILPPRLWSPKPLNIFRQEIVNIFHFLPSAYPAHLPLFNEIIDYEVLP